MTLKPFADDSGSLAIGGLTVENGRDRLAIYGSLDLTRDQAGLAHARLLHGLLAQAVAALEAADALPEHPAPPPAPRTVRNPFG